MAAFEPAIAWVLPHEGGYSNDPADSGGATMYGITEATARRNGYQGDMRDLDLDTAKSIYETDPEYWPGLEQVNDQAVAAKILDMRVNFGKGGATRIVQQAVNTLVDPPVAVDGGWGPDTLDAVNTADPKALVSALASTAADHYKAIAQSQPQKAKFLNGWLDRAFKIPPSVIAAGSAGLLLVGLGLFFLLSGSGRRA